MLFAIAELLVIIYTCKILVKYLYQRVVSNRLCDRCSYICLINSHILIVWVFCEFLCGDLDFALALAQVLE